VTIAKYHTLSKDHAFQEIRDQSAFPPGIPKKSHRAQAENNKRTPDPFPDARNKLPESFYKIVIAFSTSEIYNLYSAYNYSDYDLFI
jgi:hypothetical protein